MKTFPEEYPDPGEWTEEQIRAFMADLYPRSGWSEAEYDKMLGHALDDWPLFWRRLWHFRAIALRGELGTH